MKKNNIAIVGANGKMGSLLCESLKDKYEVMKVTENNSLKDFKNIGLVVDFACASSSVESARFCAEKKIPLLIASTGQDDEQLKIIEKCAKDTPIMVSSNLSIGICLVKKLIDSIINKFSYDITIYEKHHKTKIDKPSGTAKLLKKYICDKCNNKEMRVDILSERGGKEVGTHSINFYLDDELISINHVAYSRTLFVKGAEIAIEFIKKQTEKRLYNFDEVVCFDN